MYLHHDAALFDEAVLRTSLATQKPASFIVKDYFVTMFLKEIIARNSQLVFKGGTALSKCYGVIKRFSEDIDLGIEEPHATQGQRKKIKEAIKQSAATLGLNIANLDTTRSKREFNRYEIPLPESASGDSITNTLIVETALMTPIAPSQLRSVESFIGRYLQDIGRADLVQKYGLEPFDVHVTALERSFCDKVFAVCDYYMEGKNLQKPSRHIYDIAKLKQAISLDSGLSDLMSAVRAERDNSLLNCPSASDNVVLSSVFCEVLDREVYRQGYVKTTMQLLDANETLTYDQAAQSLREVADWLSENGM